MRGVLIVAVVGFLYATAAEAILSCPSCGAQWPDDYNYCKDCGTALVPMVTCPSCGAQYREGTVSCTCGFVFLRPKAVTITAEPKQAEIYVNAVARGKGKVEVILVPGENVLIEAHLDGYGTYGRSLAYADTPKAIDIVLTKSTTRKPTPPKTTGVFTSFLESDILLWSAAGLSVASLGYGYYNETKAAKAADKGNAANDHSEIDFYKNEVAKFERTRNAFYLAGGTVAIGAAYLGAKRIFFRVNVTAIEARVVISVGF